MTRFLAALMLTSAVLCQHAVAATFDDALLTFTDTGLVAEGSASIFWLSDHLVLINAKREGERAADTDVVLYDLKTGDKRTVVQNAWVRCWTDKYHYGVVHTGKKGGEHVWQKLEQNSEATVEVQQSSVNKYACSSDLFDASSRSLQYDLGKGNGIIEIDKPLNPTRATYVQENGARIELTAPGATFGKPHYYAWRNAYRVGTMPDGQGLLMSPHGDIQVDDSAPPVHSYFKGPHPIRTRAGDIVLTGVWDPFNGDTFFLKKDTPPSRIYKSKGFNDQIGAASVGPNGCLVMLSMAEGGLIGRLQAFANTAKNTLHWTDVCTLNKQK